MIAESNRPRQRDRGARESVPAGRGRGPMPSPRIAAAGVTLAATMAFGASPGALHASPGTVSLEAAVSGDAAISLDVGQTADGRASTDERWLPWLGCWEPETPSEGAGEESGGAGTVVCFRPDPEGKGVLVQGVVEGEVVSQEPLVADGRKREVERGGCAGEETARWSDDDTRIYLHSRLQCTEDVSREQTAILGFDGPERWVEVESVRSGEADPETGVRGFRAIPDAELPERGIAPLERPEDLAVATSREAAAAPLTAQDVGEASRHVQPGVVKAFILERGMEPVLDAETLVALEDSGAPGEVIDLVVALAHPEDFQIDAETATPGRRAPERDEPARSTAYGPVPGSGGWVVFAPTPYRPGPAYGFGPRFPSYRGGLGGIRVTRTETAGTRVGRAIKGVGYVRGDGPSARGDSSERGDRERPPRRTRGDSSAGNDSEDRSRVTPQGVVRGDDDRDRGSDRDRDRRRDRSGGDGDGGDGGGSR